MSPTSVTFKCGSCGNLLSIGAELTGQVVRCPYCQQVVQVPAMVPVPPTETAAANLPDASTNGPGATAVSAEQAVAAGDAARGAQATWADSASTEPISFTPPSSTGETAPWLASAGTEVEAKTEPMTPIGVDRTLEWLPPASGSLPPTPAVSTAAVETSNPWDKTELLDPPSHSAVSLPTGPAARPGPMPAPHVRRKLPWSIKLLAVLVPYSVMATAGLAFLVHRGLNRPVHPLEELQDQGIYESIAFDGRRKENLSTVSDMKDNKKNEIQNPLEPLADWMPRVKLGATQRFGLMDGIEVTPLDVTRRKLDYIALPEDRQAFKDHEVLVLRLKIKNVSSVIFHPDDPTFNRAYRTETKPYTFLQLGDKRFYGVVDDPLLERVKGQNFNPLLPDEEMETLIVAHGSERRDFAVETLGKLPSDTPLVWRVHLRKGREDVRLKVSGRVRTLWTTTIVPVVFTRADVKTATASAPAADAN